MYTEILLGVGFGITVLYICTCVIYTIFYLPVHNTDEIYDIDDQFIM